MVEDEEPNQISRASRYQGSGFWLKPDFTRKYTYWPRKRFRKLTKLTKIWSSKESLSRL